MQQTQTTLADRRETFCDRRRKTMAYPGRERRCGVDRRVDLEAWRQKQEELAAA